MMTKQSGKRRTEANRARLLRDMRGAIKRAFELDRAGIEQKQIAKMLNAEGYHSRSGLPFTQGTICHLLHEFAGENLD